MIEQTPIFLRAHIEAPPKPKRGFRSGWHDDGPREKWPTSALVIDCETTLDARQNLTFGFFRYCRLMEIGVYVCVKEGLFYPDDLEESDPKSFALLQQCADRFEAETPDGFPRKLEVLSRSEFIEQVFWRSLLITRAFVVGFNLPFDLVRLAVGWSKARSGKRGWSIVMSQDEDPETGQIRNSPFRPRIQIEPIDSKAAIISLTGLTIRRNDTKKRISDYIPGRFLDLRTLGWALRNESFDLNGAAEAFGVQGKHDHEPTGLITPEEIEYCRQDVRVTTNVLNAMRTEYERHPIDLEPDRAFSPATIAKSYLRAMGITPPLQKFAIPPNIQGKAMQAYYGGRAECRIRHTVVPVVFTDFMSQYPTVNTLMGLWNFLTAERLEIEEATSEIRELVASATAESALQQAFWRKLPFFALVRPNCDILPVRAEYNGNTTNIGVNSLTSEEPLWYAGPELIEAKILGGHSPEIIRAFRVVPRGKQEGLKPVRLLGVIEVDPSNDDFFKTVIEARQKAKRDPNLSEADRKALSYFLKILANAGSYGLFVEVRPERLPKGKRQRVQVYSGERQYSTTTTIIERSGTWYCPIFASLITAAGRLLLALLESSVRDAGGSHLLCDTDSLAIVASEAGGLVPCVGGPHQMPDGRDAINALSWGDVDQIVNRLDVLHPYNRKWVRDPILKIEDVNFTDGKQREILGYSIAAKRYALLTNTDGRVNIERGKAHGLGFLHPPTKGFHSTADAPVWVVDAWQWLLAQHLGQSCDRPAWFNLPAMMRLRVTTPQVLKVLQSREANSPFSERVKPFNFVLSPMIDEIDGYPVECNPNRFTLVGPFTKDTSRWHKLKYVNTHDGKSYRLGRPESRLPSEAEAQTLGDVISRYRWHPEAKSLGPDGNPCTRRTEGLLQRTPVIAHKVPCLIGKETDRRWEQGEDISMVDKTDAVVYTPDETEQLVRDPDLQRDARRFSIRVLAKKARVTENRVKAARRGDRLRRSTVEKLKRAVSKLDRAEKERA